MFATTRRLVAPAILLLPAACSPSDPPGEPQVAEFDFNLGPQNFIAGFADYPAGQEDSHELSSDHRAVPPEIGSGRSALFISGNNHSDDLFMFYKRRLTGLAPGAQYRVGFEVEIATEAQSNCAGAGGAPGESVILKAGGSNVEPLAANDGSGNLRMNVDKGDQATGGSAALVLGHIANGQPCGTAQSFALKTLAGQSLTVTTDAGGAVWLLVGTDSGFEATTRLYYTRLTARFTPSPS
jgi:hypothetical protein